MDVERSHNDDCDDDDDDVEEHLEVWVYMLTVA